MISREQLEAMSAAELQVALQRVSDGVTRELAARSTELATKDLLLVDESAGDALWLAVKEMNASKRSDRVTHSLAALHHFASALGSEAMVMTLFSRS